MEISLYYSKIKQFLTPYQLKYTKGLRRCYRKYLHMFGYSRQISRFLFRLAQGASYALILLVVIDIFALLAGKSGDFGAFGDFLGGALNPLFTLLMFVGLIITIVLQQKELSLTRKELEASAKALRGQERNLEFQRFENTFFKLLELFNDAVERVQIKPRKNITYTGREAFKQIERRLDDENISGINYVLERSFQTVEYYVKILATIIRFIDDNKFDNKLYIDTINSLLSDNELITLLFYINIYHGTSCHQEYVDLLIKYIDFYNNGSGALIFDYTNTFKKYASLKRRNVKMLASIEKQTEPV
ncbi:hypothetical protein [Zooshikella sp. RANM57]|uniref:hypothetical protein n=1 Tax=Zooshikella sp. RANM57 TaxID=3425863 RepID=UPI003D6E514B